MGSGRNRVVVVNAGSSSLKYAAFALDESGVRAEQRSTGLVEKVGQEQAHLRHTRVDGSPVEDDVHAPDHATALEVMQTALRRDGVTAADVVAVGHRVVHGAGGFTTATVVDAAVEAEIERLAPLAPLHNPPNLAGIRSARQAFPDVPQVAVFDTAFHATIQAAAFTYALPTEFAEPLELRRWGFHGINAAYVTRTAAQWLGRPVDDVQLVICHLGNGASVTAVRDGRSVDTSMGMTTLEGLVMGTRSGDVDPAVLVRLQEEHGLSATEALDVLNHRSGLLGLCGDSDMRAVCARADSGDAAAVLALSVYTHRVRKYVGAYLAELPALDALVFTAGVGEHAADVRRHVVAPIAHLGLRLDDEANEAVTGPSGPVAIDDGSGGPAVLVIPADEEIEIAQQTHQLLST
jgi:acetate kinase